MGNRSLVVFLWLLALAWSGTACAAEPTSDEAKRLAFLLWAMLALFSILCMAAGVLILILRGGARLRRQVRRKRKTRYVDLRGELELYSAQPSDQEPHEPDGEDDD